MFKVWNNDKKTQGKQEDFSSNFYFFILPLCFRSPAKFRSVKFNAES